MTTQIKEFMTLTPYTVTQDLPIREALEMMDNLNIRHLPVEYAGKVVGILLYSDLQHAIAFHTNRILKVEEVMIRQPYSVSPNAELGQVMLEMSRGKQDYVIIQQDGKIFGILTATDAFRILSEILLTQKGKAA